MMWSYWIHDTLTGAQRARIYPSDLSWSTSFTGMGTSQFTLKLLDRRYARTRDQWRDLLVGNDTTLVIVWSDDEDVQVGVAVAYAGLLIDYDYDYDTGSLTWVTSEVRGALASKRLTFGVNNYPLGNLTLVNLSYKSAVRAIIERATQWSPDWNLPLDLSLLPSGQAGPYTKDAANYETLSMADLLSDVEGRGVVVYFRPLLDANRSLFWRVYVLTAVEVLGDFTVSASHKNSQVVALHEKGSASKQVSGIFAIGNGTGKNMITAWAPRPEDGLPPFTLSIIRDEKRTVKTITDQAQLQSYANAEYLASRLPLYQRPFAINLDEVPNRNAMQLGLSRVQMGYRLTLTLEDTDPWMEPGPFTTRIMAMSGDMSPRIVPEVQNA